METNRLYRLAERSGITVERFPLPENGSVSLKSGDNMYIAMDESAQGSCERVYLAHELGHCINYAFYNVYSPFDIREKHEKKANRWAINALIPKTRYFKALREGYDNVYSLAEYFNVTPDFMAKAVEFYKTA